MADERQNWFNIYCSTREVAAAVLFLLEISLCYKIRDGKKKYDIRNEELLRIFNYYNQEYRLTMGFRTSMQSFSMSLRRLFDYSGDSFSLRNVEHFLCKGGSGPSPLFRELNRIYGQVFLKVVNRRFAHHTGKGDEVFTAFIETLKNRGDDAFLRPIEILRKILETYARVSGSCGEVKIPLRNLDQDIDAIKGVLEFHNCIESYENLQ